MLVNGKALKPDRLSNSNSSALYGGDFENEHLVLGLGDDLAHSSIRFSLGRFTKDEEIDAAIDLVSNGVTHMRDLSPIWEMYKEGVDLDSVQWQEH